MYVVDQNRTDHILTLGFYAFIAKDFIEIFNNSTGDECVTAKYQSQYDDRTYSTLDQEIRIIR